MNKDTVVETVNTGLVESLKVVTPADAIPWYEIVYESIVHTVLFGLHQLLDYFVSF